MKFIIALIFLLLILPITYSWGYTTHEWFCEKLYENNQDLKKIITNKEEFLRGCLAPDKEYDDQNNHHCYVSKECKLINVSKIDPGSLTYFSDMANCVEGTYFHCPALIKFEEAIKNSTIDNPSFYIGVSTHYMTDAYTPVHQIMGEDYYKCHAPFEREINNKLEKNEGDWEVSTNCDIYFPCKKAGKAVRKCENSYNVDVTFSYKDIIEALKKTDHSLSSKLNITEGNYDSLSITGNIAAADYRYLIEIVFIFCILAVITFLLKRKNSR